MAQRQHATPVILEKGSARPLTRVAHGDRGYNEDWLQALLFRHPELLPIGDLEPDFGGAVPVCRELPTGRGYLDLLCVNERGYLTLVETKLWRNPESRREVVAQIIDYATDIAGWNYDDLVRAIRQSPIRASGDNPLLEAARSRADDFDEAEFCDAVGRNLRRGRHLLLIAGDGVKEDPERMADHLHRVPQLGFTLGLVELSLYRASPDPESALLVVPRVVARTREITRAVVEIRTPLPASAVVVTTQPEATSDSKQPSSREVITLNDFLDQLGKLRDGSAAKSTAETVLSLVENHADLEIRWGSGGPLIQYVDEERGARFVFGQLGRQGQLTQTGRLIARLEQLSLDQTIARGYYDELASLIPGARRAAFSNKNGSESESVVMATGGRFDWPPLSSLAGRESAWMAAIDRALAKIKAELAGQARV